MFRGLCLILNDLVANRNKLLKSEVTYYMCTYKTQHDKSTDHLPFAIVCVYVELILRRNKTHVNGHVWYIKFMLWVSHIQYQACFKFWSDAMFA